MSEYIFKNWNEFGIFYRVNEKRLTDSLSDLDLTPLSDFSKACIATAGGCGCTKKKRIAAAVQTYESALEFVSSNDALKSEIKKLLNNPEKVKFNHPAASLSDAGAVTGLGVNEQEGGKDYDPNFNSNSPDREQRLTSMPVNAWLTF
tara:strand:+ start:17002 stop:17442 length:441 start_codon:yes stop_codon:yes gene_type:complete